MALGFDMKDPIIDPANATARASSWIAFFKDWNQKPTFAGRYFWAPDADQGQTEVEGNWKWQEVPHNITTLVPNSFDNLEYICPFTPARPTTSPEVSVPRMCA